MTDALLMAGELVLAVVFIVAAVAKLADPAGTRESMRAFGAPASFAVAVPLAELAVAVSLLFTSTARWGALAAAALLLAFSAMIAVSLARDRAPDCHCFGQLSSGPVGRSTLVRNTALLLIAGTVAVLAWDGEGPALGERVGALETAEAFALGATVVSLITAILVGIAFVRLLNAHGRVLVRLDALEGRRSVQASPGDAGLPVGTPVPSLNLIDVDGERHALAELAGFGRPLLLMFVSPRCGPCHAATADIARRHRDAPGRVSLAVVTDGSRDEARATAEEHGLGLVLLDADQAAFRAFHAPGTPSAILIGTDGRVAAPIAGGQAAIERLLDDAGRPAAAGDATASLDPADLKPM